MIFKIKNNAYYILSNTSENIRFINKIIQTMFTYSKNQLKQIALDILFYAKKKGASNTTVHISEENGLSVSVRKGQIETIEQNKDKSISLTLYIGKNHKMQHGNASTSDFSQKAIENTVKAAYDIARFTATDNCAGLPDPEDLEMHARDLKLYSPWLISTHEAIKLACRCENAALEFDKRITNSEGASIYIQQSHFITANSHSFINGYPFSQHTISVTPIAGKGNTMQRDSWYSSECDPKKLSTPEIIGCYAAERALARLHAKKLSTRKCPVLFEAPLATSLLGMFVQAISGGALYRKSSFLLDSLGKQVFPAHLHMIEDPHIMSSLGSAPFDDEGVKTYRRQVVKNGIVQGYFLSTYSARKLGMKTTGNSGGSHNLSLISSLTTETDTFQGMLKKLDTGLLVTELMGHGINYITGDYSRGAFGYWVEQGIIQYPVEEITIASNMKEMLRHIIAIGNDTLIRGNKETGSILLENMTIAGI